MTDDYLGSYACTTCGSRELCKCPLIPVKLEDDDVDKWELPPQSVPRVNAIFWIRESITYPNVVTLDWNINPQASTGDGSIRACCTRGSPD